MTFELAPYFTLTISSPILSYGDFEKEIVPKPLQVYNQAF